MFRRKYANRLDADTILGEKAGGPAGSNTAGVSGFWKGTDGVKRYVKNYHDEAQVYGEHLANFIYKKLGIKAPTSHVFMHRGKPVFASEIIDQLEASPTLGAHGAAQPGGSYYKPVIPRATAEKIAGGFAADVLLANWDAVGTGMDNILIHGTNGEPYRVDQGGSFLMRAQAGRKPQGAIHAISEWERFFENPYYSEVMSFAGIRAAEQMAESLIDQIQAIEDLRSNYGGWDELVSDAVPDWMGEDRDETVAMLETRTNLLRKKKMELERQLAGIHSDMNKMSSFKKYCGHCGCKL